MHIYIYDTYVNTKKYDNIVAQIETRITDLGLNGKIVRLGVTNSLNNTIEEEVKKGAKTIVVVGNNRIFSLAINTLAKLKARKILNKKVSLGFIPVGKKENEIATFLGIAPEVNACDIISARRLKSLDLGLANDNYFLSEAAITTANTVIEIDENYSLEINEPGDIKIINLLTLTNASAINSSPFDNILDLHISTKSTKKAFNLNKGSAQDSVISFKTLKIINNQIPMVIDGTTKLSSPVNIKIAKEKIDLIVGKIAC